EVAGAVVLVQGVGEKDERAARAEAGISSCTSASSASAPMPMPVRARNSRRVAAGPAFIPETRPPGQCHLCKDYHFGGCFAARPVARLQITNIRPVAPFALIHRRAVHCNFHSEKSKSPPEKIN